MCRASGKSVGPIFGRVPTSRLGVLAFALLVGCGDANNEPMARKVPVPGELGAAKTPALVRAQRRAYDGAPPVIAHDNFKIDCLACHHQQGVHVPPHGFAPPSPHGQTQGLSAISRCQQCHVFSLTDQVFVTNSFDGLRQDLRRGKRLNDLAPPVLPHPIFMRENCLACHSGPATREEIRCTHPERTRCTQCHLTTFSNDQFDRQDPTSVKILGTHSTWRAP